MNALLLCALDGQVSCVDLPDVHSSSLEDQDFSLWITASTKVYGYFNAGNCRHILVSNDGRRFCVLYEPRELNGPANLAMRGCVRGKQIWHGNVIICALLELGPQLISVCAADIPIVLALLKSAVKHRKLEQRFSEGPF
ncbi:hypothetical protein EYR38_009149 [Pleurotus pulmonarius]|nr:hypothetical protein EYR38_009149 [Pleurotus pulmonarius]